MKKFSKILLTSVIAASLSACIDDDDPVVMAENSYLRVLHAAADAPKVNVWLDGKPALEGVDYQQTSGAIKVAAGSHTVRVDAILPDGKTLTVIPETTLDLAKDMEYNVVALGKAALIGSGDAAEFGPAIISRAALTPEGARVQAIHAAPDAPIVDIFITAPNADLSAATPFADDVSYKANTEAVEVPAGTYQVRLAKFDDPNVVYFDSGAVNLAAGSDWVVAAVKNTDAGESPVNLLIDSGTGPVVVKDVNTGADIRVVHTISDAPAVDVWVNGTAPAMGSPLYNLAYKAKTDYMPVAAGDYDFAVSVNGSDPVTVVDALGLKGATLAAGMTYTAMAIGNLGDNADNDELFVVTDKTRRVATEAQLRAIHASTMAGNVDIYLSADASPSDDDVILKNIPYKGDSTVLSVMPGTAYVMITPAGDASTIAIGPAELPLAAGTLTTLVAIDDPAAATGVSVMSLDD
ncbi:DUF4397 domain-containing protein [Motilimonas sp. E26]|uniref:DUF4397 domain-containing protein n=1 Tax=Motilimonas sp. E26 TaxID=2865674 RepID=UPI001E5D7494|nr:DUF4397 domain-containing protein [Motilimonas sp. E26]MCE0558355.1 DUF4397 domain-containing protein [Motilimonas sp. E26]